MRIIVVLSGLFFMFNSTSVFAINTGIYYANDMGKYIYVWQGWKTQRTWCDVPNNLVKHAKFSKGYKGKKNKSDIESKGIKYWSKACGKDMFPVNLRTGVYGTSNHDVSYDVFVWKNGSLWCNLQNPDQTVSAVNRYGRVSDNISKRDIEEIGGAKYWSQACTDELFRKK